VNDSSSSSSAGSGSGWLVPAECDCVEEARKKCFSEKGWGKRGEHNEREGGGAAAPPVGEREEGRKPDETLYPPSFVIFLLSLDVG